MDTTQIILIVFIGVLLIAYPIMMVTKNKKENQRMMEQTNSLKRGDKVLTTSGVYGTIVDLQLEQDRKIVTIETGTDKKKGYVSVDAYSIYAVLNDEAQAQSNSLPVEEKVETYHQPKEEIKADDKKPTIESLEKKVTGKRQSKKKDI